MAYGWLWRLAGRGVTGEKYKRAAKGTNNGPASRARWQSETRKNDTKLTRPLAFGQMGELCQI